MIMKIAVDRIAHNTYVIRAYNENDHLSKTFNVYEDLNRFALITAVRARCQEGVHDEARIEYLQERTVG
jgi:hypothetical protein